MNPKSIKEVGVPALLIGIGQMVFTFLLGFLISFKVLNLDLTSSVYIGLAVAFSSTIIAIKLISDKGEIDSIYGKLSIGILILQDVVAIVVLMKISATSSGTAGSFGLTSILEGAGLIVILFLFGFFLLPRITKSIAKSSELLFLFAITWAFGIAALFGVIGFSVEIGALIAGVLLSTSPYGPEIGSRISPLKDFFLILFFILLGLNVQITTIGSIIVPSLVLSAVVLIFKPLIIMILTRFFGYTKRNNFLVGVTLGQVSEFSLILLALAVSLGQSLQNVLAIITLTTIITITLSSYLTVFADKIYKKISKPLSIFERKELRRERETTKEYSVILFGYNRTGFGILKALEELNESFLVIDFNPDIISKLERWHIPCMYGDAYDSDFLSDLPFGKAKTVISTIPEFETNLLLLNKIKSVNPNSTVILRTAKINEALELYKKGADYVLTPYIMGGEHIAEMIKQNRNKKGVYSDERERHIKLLKEVLQSEKPGFK